MSDFLKDIIKEVIGDKTKEVKPVEAAELVKVEPNTVVENVNKDDEIIDATSAISIGQEKIQKEIKEIKNVLKKIQQRFNSHRHKYLLSVGGLSTTDKPFWSDSLPTII